MQRLPVCLDERGLDRFLDQQIVRLHAGLPGVQDLAERDAPRGELHIGGFVHDDGALAAELQRDGREIFGRSLHHDLADGDAAGEENGVEALRQQRAVFRASALDSGDIAWVKRLGDELRDGRAGRGGISRRLYDGTVAAGDRAHQRRQAELNGIIPRRDDQRNAIRLRRDKAFRVELRQRRRDGALTHPALQMLQMEAHLLEHHARFAHINLHRGLAEVLIHGLLQQLLVCLQRAL